jgi:hypothetical protein
MHYLFNGKKNASDGNGGNKEEKEDDAEDRGTRELEVKEAHQQEQP